MKLQHSRGFAEFAEQRRLMDTTGAATPEDKWNAQNDLEDALDRVDHELEHERTITSFMGKQHADSQELCKLKELLNN